MKFGNMFENIHSFYRSKEWQELLQTLKLERVNDKGQLICEYCGKEIVKSYDCIGHHKIELNERNVNNLDISLNTENIMLIHFKCHNKIHQRFGNEGTKKVYIVYGSPCSGKTTWVNNNAEQDDLIVDLDKIWECISINDRTNKSNRLKTNVFGVRDCLLEQIKLRSGKWKNAFVVGTYPLKMDRLRLADRIGAELIYIECDKSTALSRAINREWEGYINEWFDMYQE